ncbi:MAG: hypothetical protein KGZ63_13675 [Clostridiales bacterium]|jgi:hypothetical protein|nr:hypothetical protein [Clostridiales bacterium]
MFRYLATAIFIIPKLVVWPLIWLYRCRIKKNCTEEIEIAEEKNECVLLTEEE